SMRWTWRFKARTGANGHKEANGSVDGDAGPDFLCVGAHKGGTTWLYQQLDSHPDFWMPPVKELHYLDQLSRVQRTSPPRCRDEIGRASRRDRVSTPELALALTARGGPRHPHDAAPSRRPTHPIDTSPAAKPLGSTEDV